MVEVEERSVDIAAITAGTILFAAVVAAAGGAVAMNMRMEDRKREIRSATLGRYEDKVRQMNGEFAFPWNGVHQDELKRLEEKVI